MTARTPQQPSDTPDADKAPSAERRRPQKDEAAGSAATNTRGAPVELKVRRVGPIPAMNDLVEPDRPPFQTEPIVAKADPEVWSTWWHHVLTGAKDRLAKVSLLLVLALALEAAVLYGLGILVDRVFDGETMAIDRGVLLTLRTYHTPLLDRVMTVISMFGSEILVGLVVMVAIYLVWSRRWGAAASLILVVAGASVLNGLIKGHFQRPRPTEFVAPLLGVGTAQQWSFPSGHAMVSAAFYLFVAYLTWRLLRGWLRIAWTTGLIALILLIGLSRLYLGLHYFTDVIAGYAAGSTWTETVILAGKLMSYRQWSPLERRRAARGVRQQEREQRKQQLPAKAPAAPVTAAPPATSTTPTVPLPKNNTVLTANSPTAEVAPEQPSSAGPKGQAAPRSHAA